MDPLILHHYELSPYAAKIRMILAFKGLPWKSVEVPVVMPKPLLGALTGGWRMVPVLQIGAEIFFDTKLIAEQLERIRSTPSIYSSTDPVREEALVMWGQSAFWDGVRMSLCEEGRLPAAFLEDRRKMAPENLLNLDHARAEYSSLVDRVRAHIVLAERQLAHGGRFLCGDQPTLADFAAWVSFGPARTRKNADVMFAGCEKVMRWLGRLAAYDVHSAESVSGEEALAVAAAATPDLSTGVEVNDPNGFKVGERIGFSAMEYRCEPVYGEILRANASWISVLREDPSVGKVVLHFPRGLMRFTRA
jgi:glutathione S-transferase